MQCKLFLYLVEIFIETDSFYAHICAIYTNAKNSIPGIMSFMTEAVWQRIR